MESLAGKIVLVSGASSGIGAACVELMAPLEAKIVLMARRADRLQQVIDRCVAAGADPGNFHPIVADVRERTALSLELAQLPSDWQAIDILINNAGLSRGLDKLQAGLISDWEEMIDTNIKGLLYLTRAIVPGMVERNRGHIVNLGSIAGHQAYPAGNVYCGTKAAVRAISAGLKIDLLGTPIRVTNIDPGLVETEFSAVRFHGDWEQAHQVYAGLTPLSGMDVAETILFALTRPAHVNLSEILLVPTAQATPTLVSRQLSETSDH